MTDLQSRYRRQRKRGIPASSALSIARAESKDYGWEPSRNTDEWTQEREGFTLTLKLEPDYDIDISTYGDFVDSRPNSEYYSEPTEDTPLGLPAAHFAYQGHTQGDWGFFFPAYVEDEYQWLRTKGGYARQPAREEITRRVEEWCSQFRDLSSYVATLTASRNGIELGSSVIGGFDFYDLNEWEVLSLVEDHGMADTAIEEAQEAIASLT